MLFHKAASLKFGLTMITKKKIRGRNRVKSFMRLPFTVARWAGVYIPLPKFSLCVYSFRTLLALLSYLGVTAWQGRNKTASFSGIIFLFCDVLRAVLQPFFLIETIRKGKYFVAALKKLSDVEQGLSAMGKPTFSNEQVLTPLIIRSILTCGTVLGGVVRQCKSPSISVMQIIHSMMMNTIMFYFWANWFVLMAFLSMVRQQFDFLTRHVGAIPIPTKNSFTNPKKVSALAFINEFSTSVFTNVEIFPCFAGLGRTH